MQTDIDCIRLNIIAKGFRRISSGVPNIPQFIQLIHSERGKEKKTGKPKDNIQDSKWNLGLQVVRPTPVHAANFSHLMLGPGHVDMGVSL